MSAIVQTAQHTHIPRRDDAGMEIPSKEHKIGNTTVIVHSPLVLMTPEERKLWFESEWEKGNPILKSIADAVEDCYRT